MLHICRRDELQDQSDCRRTHESEDDHHSPLVVALGEQARHGAPDQRYEVSGSHDEARHGGSEAQLSEVEGEEGEQAGSGAAAQEVKGAGQSEGPRHVDLLVALHGRPLGRLAVRPRTFHVEHLTDRETENTISNSDDKFLTRTTIIFFNIQPPD